ncbi:MAG: hypothetical protein WD552_00435 [Candidatus Paceibacterota bacterium]
MAATKDRVIKLENGILTIDIEPLSLLQLLEKYGTGKEGFYHKVWWFDEDFAKDVPEPGIYEIKIKRPTRSFKEGEDESNMPKGWDFPHPAIIAQAILQYYQKTGKRLLGDWWTRSSLTNCNNRHVYIGNFMLYNGLSVDYRWDDYLFSGLGVAPFRKIP